MAHFYQIETIRGTDKHSAFLREDITTPAQARKERINNGKIAVASVTEKLKLFPSEFFNNWRIKEGIRITRDNLHLDDSTIAERIWGTRRHPVTGEEVGSAAWGTECHKHLESAMNNNRFPNEWEPFIKPFIAWTNKSAFEVLATETVIASTDPSYNTAGTIDLLAKINGRVSLLDYKTRKVSEGGDIKKKALPKDCMQLASESHMVRDMMHLDYNPKIYTVLIDTETGSTHVKEWSDKAFEKALSNAISCFIFYDGINGL
tara:strand:- start:559 stop:1341 length:783 start_codon:yes stop_codon:yes gene_type:complete